MGILDRQVAILTGSGTGIGAAAAVRFVQEGASVVLVGRRKSMLEQTAASINQPDRVAIVAGDVTAPETSRAAIRAATQRFGRLDIVISNAATCEPTPLLTTNYDDWRRIFDIIMLGSYRFTREAAQAMIDAKTAGRIVNVTSIHGTQAESGVSGYGAAKAAVNQFTRCMAVELAPHNIRVNALAPGFVNTPMSVRDGINELDDPRFLQQYCRERRIPLARAALPEEMAGPLLFLASADSSYITGHVLVADGGLTCTF